ncbi:hypothetical protein B1748_31355 [Paenibacillus sp. MY03]|uniref:hypothetical protein n=1 Tax=Paenibacillus sp. MY03 TaxID=302980 RepID=UPI000B3C3722|nr:hypothetical protein [Paenibacillus sp. MY03]OUS69480.1 hypothetical protein B1748_31355 [Paenibacillus sp. MY03]
MNRDNALTSNRIKHSEKASSDGWFPYSESACNELEIVLRLPEGCSGSFYLQHKYRQWRVLAA